MIVNSDAIRKAAEEIHKSFGGKLNIEQWENHGDYLLKVVMTWRPPEKENTFFDGASLVRDRS